MKSHVSMDQHQCVVCGQLFETNNLLLDKKFKPTMDKYTVTGEGLCKEHLDLYEEGYLALVEIDPQKSSNAPVNGEMNNKGAYRTGKVAHMKVDVFNKVFDAGVDSSLPMVFVEPGLIEKIEEMQQE